MPFDEREEALIEVVTAALERIKNLESMILSWEDRLRACECQTSTQYSPRPDGSVFSSSSSFADEFLPFSSSRRALYRDHADGKCGIKSCMEEALPDKRFCRKHISRACHYPGCTKTRLGPEFCIRHGGGKRCEFPGCTKGASGTVGGGARWCIAHGGGRKCRIEGCKSTAKRAGLCSSHGGRYMCSVAGCTKTAHGPRRLCTMHATGRTPTTMSRSPDT